MPNPPVERKGSTKISVTQKLVLLCVILLMGTAFTGYSIYQTNQKRLNAEEWVRHTEHVISLTENILSTGKDIETATRGFVITDDSTFLDPLFDAQKKVFVRIALLRQLTHDNLLQQMRVDSLNFYMHKRLDFSLQTISLRRKQGLIAASAYTAGKTGLIYTDHLQRISNTIQNEEKMLLQQRKEINDYRVNIFNGVSVGMFILMILSMILLLITTGKYWVQNQEKEERSTALIVANKELFFQNGEKEKRFQESVIANRNLKLSEDQLKEVNSELESFSYSVSHDLRAPLRAVHGYAKMLNEAYQMKMDAEAGRLMEKIITNAKRMGQLIDDLLTFSRIGRKELVKINVQMHDMVSNLCEEFKTEHPGRNIEFHLGALPPALADKNSIKHIWLNLISNAVKYSANKVRAVIDIGSEIKGAEIIYHIKDNGAGFDMRYVRKLFGVFQRLHSEEDFEGTGVGLALVQRIVSKHGGRIWAEGRVNEGAIFSFTLKKE